MCANSKFIFTLNTKDIVEKYALRQPLASAWRCGRNHDASAAMLALEVCHSAFDSFPYALPDISAETASAGKRPEDRRLVLLIHALFDLR